MQDVSFNGCQRLAVWPVRDCGLQTYQGTPKFEAGYKHSHTTETLIGYDRVLGAVWFFKFHFCSSSTVNFQIMYKHKEF
jgi:hypothetical protein